MRYDKIPGMINRPTRVAVIGLGKLGARHADVYSGLSGVELVGVCDIHEDKASEVAERCKTRAYTDHKKLLGLVDAVSIVVPSESHYRVAKDFLDNGVHLLVEKPLTTQLADADKLISHAKRKKLLLQVGHIERFNSGVQRLKKLVKNPHFIECRRLGPYDPRVIKTGVTLDLMIHDIDIVTNLVGSKIKRVDATGGFLLSRTEDIANARILFENGAVASLTASRVNHEVSREIRVFQDNAYITLDYVTKEAMKYTKDGIEKIDIEKKDSLKEELSDFIQCVRTKKQPLVSGEEGRAALELALRITQSIRKPKNPKMVQNSSLVNGLSPVK
jgi:predicted dehydrogenase